MTKGSNWSMGRKIISVLAGIGLILTSVLLLKVRSNRLEKPPQSTETMVTATSDLPVIPVTFETIANHEGEKISIEGMIWLGGAVSCYSVYACDDRYLDDTYMCCHLELTQDGSYRVDEPGVTLALKKTRANDPKPNCFYIPENFTPDDFRIYANDGQTMGIDDLIRVIGMVHKENSPEGRTIMQIYVLEIEAGE